MKKRIKKVSKKIKQKVKRVVSRADLQRLLDQYKYRLSTRLGVVVEKNWSTFLPLFEVRLHDALRARSSTSTSSLYSDTDGEVVYPEGTKYFCKQNNIVSIVIEQKPQVRTVLFDQALPEAGKPRYRLAFPYVVFIIKLCPYRGSYPVGIRHGNQWANTTSYCGFRTEPLKNIKDNLLLPNVPNVHNAAICLGNTFDNQPASLTAKAESVIGHFWQGTFSCDWAEGFRTISSMYPEQYGTLLKWEEATAEDPLFPLKIKKWPVMQSVRQYISEMGLTHTDTPLAVEVKNAAASAKADVMASFEGVDVEALDEELCKQIEGLLS